MIVRPRYSNPGTNQGDHGVWGGTGDESDETYLQSGHDDPGVPYFDPEIDAGWICLNTLPATLTWNIRVSQVETYPFGGFDLMVRDGEGREIWLTTLGVGVDPADLGSPTTLTQTFVISELPSPFVPSFTFYLRAGNWEGFVENPTRLYDWWFTATEGGWTTGYIGVSGGGTLDECYYGSST